MKKKSVILLVAAFVFLIVGAAILYSVLSKEYAPEMHAPSNTTTVESVSSVPETTVTTALTVTEATTSVTSTTAVTTAVTSTVCETTAPPTTTVKPQETKPPLTIGNAATSASATTTVQQTTPAETTTSHIPNAPDFTVLNFDQNSVKLSDFYGKPVVINFWATWCGPCKSELPSFNSMYEKYKDKVNFLMVNLTDGYNDTIDYVKSFVADNGYTFPLYFDTESSAANAYGVYSIPMTIFIDSSGDIYDYYIGSMQERTLESCLKELINTSR